MGHILPTKILKNNTATDFVLTDVTGTPTVPANGSYTVPPAIFGPSAGSIAQSGVLENALKDMAVDPAREISTLTYNNGTDDFHREIARYYIENNTSVARNDQRCMELYDKRRTQGYGFGPSGETTSSGTYVHLASFTLRGRLAVPQFKRAVLVAQVENTAGTTTGSFRLRDVTNGVTLAESTSVAEMSKSMVELTCSPLESFSLDDMLVEIQGMVSGGTVPVLRVYALDLFW